MVFIDDERPNQNYAKIIAPRISNIYYHSQLTVEIEIYGRNDIFAGDIIKLNIFNFEEMQTTKFNGSLSGYWLINSISHNIPVDRTYKSTLVLSKDLALGDNSGVSTIAELTSEFEE